MNKEQAKKILHQNKEIYNRIAKDFSGTRSRFWRGFEDFAKYVKSGDKVFDLGCGNGRLAELFNNSQIEYLGIDSSEELIKIARERFKDKSWAGFEVGDVLNFISPPFQGGFVCDHRGASKGGFESHGNNLSSKTSPWPLLGKEGKFNLVLLIAVLHHIPTKKLRLQVLKNIYSVLKPGGRLIVSNWNLWQVYTVKSRKAGSPMKSGLFNRVKCGKKKFRYWHYLWDWPEKIKRGVWGISDAFVPWKSFAGDNLRYIHFFRKGELERLLQQAGFVIEKIGFEDKNGQAATILTGDNLLAIAVKK
jgi:SAM-dependent methyltransferase